MSPLGIAQHAAEVERSRFRRLLTCEDVAPICGAWSPAEGADGGFEGSAIGSTGAWPRAQLQGGIARLRRPTNGAKARRRIPLGHGGCSASAAHSLSC